MCRKLVYVVSFVLMLGLVSVASGVEGLLGEYYHGSASDPWQTLVMERMDPTVNFSWGDGSPEPGIVNTDNFTVRWMGEIEVPASGTYTFHTQSDDGIRLWVNNEQLIDNWTDHSSTHDSGDITLTAGQRYEIRLEFYEAGDHAASHEVYFGPDKDVVRNADTGSPEYKGSKDLGSQSYDPGKLEWDTTYYWRVDEVNNVNPNSPWVGLVWSFTTADFLIVDDFELYNDLDPTDPESNRIFNVWLDGYGMPTNGSIVGYDNPPFAEQSIVHSGNQSMPLYYDNSVGYSEAALTLTYPRDWTEKGVSTLTIWFRGRSDNSAETLYVALNGSAVVFHDNPNAAQTYTWTEWTIDLSAPGGFADLGVNLANVNTIALGFGNRNNPRAGGSGTMYFDDIRLYPPSPETAP